MRLLPLADPEPSHFTWDEETGAVSIRVDRLRLRRRAIGLTLGAAAATAAVVLMLATISDLAALQQMLFLFQLISLTGIAFVAGFKAKEHWHALAETGPDLRIDAEGIFDRGLGATVPWSRIIDLLPLRMSGRRVEELVLVVRDARSIVSADRMPRTSLAHHAGDVLPLPAVNAGLLPVSPTVVAWWVFSFLGREDIAEIVADVWAEFGCVLPAADAARRYARIAGPDARAKAEAEWKRLHGSGDPEKAAGWRRIAEALAEHDSQASAPARD